MHHIQCDSKTTREYWKGARLKDGRWKSPWHLLKVGLLNAADSVELHYWLTYVEDPHHAFLFLLNKLLVQQERAEVESLVLETEVAGHNFFD